MLFGILSAIPKLVSRISLAGPILVNSPETDAHENGQPPGPRDPFANLSAKTVSSGLITGTAQAIKFALSLGSAALLGRLLTPRDFGLVGMVTTLTGFLAMFSEAGLSTATIQAEGVTHEQTSNLFWINASLGMGMGLVASALAPAIAWFYHEPRLVWVSLLLGLAFPITGLALQHRALLNRQMRFGALARIDVGSMLVSIAVACSMALTGFGYWSLVGMQLAAAASACGLAWRESPWRPGRPGRRRGIRS